jgi:hypothetical protein
MMTLAAISMQRLAWLLVALGMGVLAWAGYDFAMGQTSVEKPLDCRLEWVEKDAEPVRFRRLMMTNLVGGVTCLVIGGWLLITGG